MPSTTSGDGWVLGCSSRKVEATIEPATIAVLAAPGGVAGLTALAYAPRERRACAKWLAEVEHLDEMLRLRDEEAHSPALRRHYEARLDGSIDGFDVRDHCRDPGVRELADAHFGRLGRGG